MVPSNCANETDDAVVDESTLGPPSAFNCYDHLNEGQTQDFFKFERAVAYSNCTIGAMGLLGNLLAIFVLFGKEMRKNCFSQLLIGESFFHASLTALLYTHNNDAFSLKKAW